MLQQLQSSASVWLSSISVQKAHCSAAHKLFISMLTPLVRRVPLDLWDTRLTEHLVRHVKCSLIGFATLNSSFFKRLLFNTCTATGALIVRPCLWLPQSASVLTWPRVGLSKSNSFFYFFCFWMRCRMRTRMRNFESCCGNLWSDEKPHKGELLSSVQLSFHDQVTWQVVVFASRCPPHDICNAL